MTTMTKFATSLHMTSVINEFVRTVFTLPFRLGRIIKSFNQNPSVMDFTYLSRRSSVSVLNRHSGPSAIIPGISRVVINSIKSQSRRFHSHIFKKVKERVSPLRTNGDASASIIRKNRTLGIMASLYHGIPYFIRRRLTVAMRFISSTAFNAPFRATIPERRTHNKMDITTRTLALPSNFPFIGISLTKRENGPFSKYVASKVDKFTHMKHTTCSMVNTQHVNHIGG